MTESINLNLGGGPSWKHEGWTNLEYELGYDLASKGLSDFRDASVSRAFCSHSLEHTRPSRALVSCYATATAC